MKNSIVIKIPFGFKGELYEPKSRIDLDLWMRREHADFDKLIRQVAYENGIGSYSYELEVMESSEALYESPTGLAKPFWDEETEHFDFEGFMMHWQEMQAQAALNDIHQTVFGETLDVKSPTYQAMLKAYWAGQKARTTNNLL